MNEQIKVDELPVGGFVLDYGVPSGNKEFISYKDIYKCECDNTQWKTNKQGKKGCVQCTKGNSLNQIKFGSKHIQLVAANPSLKGNHLAWLDDDEYAYDGLMAETVGLKPETKEEVRNGKIQGKDFFIYKVSDVK